MVKVSMNSKITTHFFWQRTQGLIKTRRAKFGFIPYNTLRVTVARMLIGGGGCIFIYSGSARLVSFEIKLNSKESRRA